MTRLLAAVITGGRPLLRDRMTSRFFGDLQASGFDVEWVIREDHVDGYETDDRPLNIYSLDWANGYARAHWRHPSVRFEADGFHGAFTGREWAMKTGEERGYDAVLLLDDNVKALAPVHAELIECRRTMAPGPMLRLLADLCLSTNARMCGAQLNSVPLARSVKVIRPGYPYSVYVEKTGPGRIPYFGPFEDDIMHALDYALDGGPNRTAAVVDALRYVKTSVRHNTGGMRGYYTSQRGLEIARRYPSNVRLKVTRGTSSPADRSGSRAVRHILNTRGFTPVRVVDPDLYAKAADAVRQATIDATAGRRATARDKIRKRGAPA